MKEDKNISLKDYFDSRFNELKNYIDTKFQHVEKSTSLAQDNLNSRLESMNEFRNSMKDQTLQYITRAEHNICMVKVDSDIRYLRENDAKGEGKATQQSVIFAYIIAVIGIVIGVVGILKDFI